MINNIILQGYGNQQKIITSGYSAIIYTGNATFKRKPAELKTSSYDYDIKAPISAEKDYSFVLNQPSYFAEYNYNLKQIINKLKTGYISLQQDILKTKKLSFDVIYINETNQEKINKLMKILKAI